MTSANPWPVVLRADGNERVVRPYALTAGRTRPSGASIDLIAQVSVVRTMGATFAPEILSELGPEHLRLLQVCRSRVSVADAATDVDLPLGVVRILLADLRDRGLVSINQPVAPGINDVGILREVADALRKL
ncbi:MAG: DUF742 domain-containing protein [Nocardiopsaceae bacterium]|nr:DUF742 domain-containing protein [Nocardiopsaceae bacterium]